MDACPQRDACIGKQVRDFGAIGTCIPCAGGRKTSTYIFAVRSAASKARE
jgi:hypothetical protein